MPSLSDLHVGDKVQVKPGTRDDSLYGNRGVLIATRYTSNGSLFMEITQKGFPSDPKADYLVLSYQGVVITATKASFIASNYICSHKKQEVKPKPSKPITTSPPKTPRPPTNKIAPDPIPLDQIHTTLEGAETWYVTQGDSTNWTTSTEIAYLEEVRTLAAYSAADHSLLVNQEGIVSPGIKGSTTRFTKREKQNIADTNELLLQSVIRNPSYKSNLSVSDLIDSDVKRMQNAYGYPYAKPLTAENTQKFKVRSYDYQISPNTQLPTMGKSLRQALGEFRTLYGIPVHGEEAVAKYMKYFLYNRYKVPDTNLSQSRIFTHVFFTKPDLNILKNINGSNVQASKQCRNHTESAVLYHKNPELFKLLVDKKITGDRNNFNFLLSNQIAGIQITSEELETTTHGKSWHGYEMKYGTMYTARQANTIQLTFNETRDLSIFKLIKLWMTYIDNVSRGAWSPSYTLKNGNLEGLPGLNFEDSHAYTRTLDYAASMYVIKVAENGQDILYWTKYYGIFPVSSGAEAFSWTAGQVETTPQLNVTFQYMMKRDLNPVNLVEFNNAAGTIGPRNFLSQYNPAENHSTHPFVGTPYIEMKFPEVDNLPPNDVLRGKEKAVLRLRFDADYINSPSISEKDMFYDREASVVIKSV